MMARMRGDRLHAGFERDGRRHHRADPQIAFFELGQELGAEPRAEHAGTAPGNTAAIDRRARGSCAPRAAESPGRRVRMPRTTKVSTSLTLRRQQDRGQHRRHREGRDHRADQRIGIGARHRPEDLAFHALHREQRQERRDRDDHRKEDRLVDLDRGRSGCGCSLSLQARLAIRRIARRCDGRDGGRCSPP